MSNENMVNGMKAFIKAKSEMKSPAFNKTNPHFKNNYADLEEIRRVVKQPLADNNINLIQRFDVVDGVFMLVTDVIYDGSFIIITSRYLLSSTLSPQQLGSAITYAKRYEMSTICGLLADEDDDAEVAEKPNFTKELKDLDMTTKDVQDKLGKIKAEMKACETLEERQEMIDGEPNAKEWHTVIDLGNRMYPKNMGDINKLKEGLSWKNS